MKLFTKEDEKLLNAMGFVIPESRIGDKDLDYREGDFSGVHVEIRLRPDGVYNVLLSDKGTWVAHEADSLENAFQSAVKALENRATKELNLASFVRTLWDTRPEVK